MILRLPFTQTLTGIAIFFLLLLAACVKDPPLPQYTPPDSSFGLIYTQIFETSCGLSRCHDGQSIHPRLIGENTYFSVVTEHVHNHDALTKGLHLVKPFDPDSSFLYQKMIYDSSEFKFGAPMPQGGISVDSNKIQFLRLWIEAGAPQFGHVVDRSLIE